MSNLVAFKIKDFEIKVGREIIHFLVDEFE